MVQTSKPLRLQSISISIRDVCVIPIPVRCDCRDLSLEKSSTTQQTCMLAASRRKQLAMNGFNLAYTQYTTAGLNTTWSLIIFSQGFMPRSVRDNSPGSWAHEPPVIRPEARLTHDSLLA
jgi:hypothetical protein